MKQFSRKILGNTLVEVLVALALFCIVLLSASMMSLKSLKLSRESLFQTKALVLAEALSESMLADLKTHAGISDDMFSWQHTISQSLPEGRGSFTIEDRLATIQICWNSNVPHLQQQQFTLSLALPE